MHPDRWRRLNGLFHAALAQAPASRDAYLEAACADDPGLAEEVRSLVAAHEKASAFDRPVAGVAALLQVQDPGGPDEAGPLVGQRVGPYDIRQVLGHGGMGVVYLAEDTRLGRPVAIKALRAAYTHQAHHRARLRREAATAAALSHPNVATVFALEELDGRLYLIREYVPGHTLRDEIGGAVHPWPDVLGVAAGIARALAAAHEAGVIHRDLKPENVIRTDHGAVKVVDFGLARFDDGTTTPHERLTAEGVVAGTPGYMSPELLRGDPVDFRADQFALGVLVHELATGRHPFEAGATAGSVHVRDVTAPSIGARRVDCPPALDRIVARCLATDPRDRYPRTAEVAEELAALAAGTAAPATAPAPPPNALWWWQCHQVVIPVVYVAALYPLWHVREWMPDPWGLAAFVVAVAIVGVAANLRLHLWFTSSIYPAELAAQRRRAAPWQRSADTSFALVTLAPAISVAEAHAEWAALLIAVATTSLISARLIEPATTRAAFPADPARHGPG